jgi:hypothetical protein
VIIMAGRWESNSAGQSRGRDSRHAHHLRAILAEYQVHCNTARPHQGIAQRVPYGEHDGSHMTVTAPTANGSIENPSWAACLTNMRAA